MTKHRRDNDAVASDRALKRFQNDIATGLMNLDFYQEEIQEERPTLTRVSVKCDPDDEQGILVILKGYQGSVWMVAFHRGSSIAMALAETGNRLRNGSIKWKEDPYETGD